MVTYVFGNKGKKLALSIVTELMLLWVCPILQALLFNNFINYNLFIEKSDICKFADDNRLFSCRDYLSVISKSLENDMKIHLR